MFERIIKLMREKIRKKQYIMTLHAEEEMNNDDLTIYNVESGIPESVAYNVLCHVKWLKRTPDHAAFI